MKNTLVMFVVVLLTGGLAWADGEVNPRGLTWDHNTESDLAGYLLYKATASGEQELDGVSFAVSVPAGTNTWMFPAELVDGVFYWVVSARDIAGNESGPSNEVYVEFNTTPPAPPTGCSVIP